MSTLLDFIKPAPVSTRHLALQAARGIAEVEAELKVLEAKKLVVKRKGLWVVTSPSDQVIHDVVVKIELKQLSLDELANELQSQTMTALDNHMHTTVIRNLVQANHLIHQAARYALGANP